MQEVPRTGADAPRVAVISRLDGIKVREVGA